MAREAEERQEYDSAWGTEKADYYNADVIETEQDALEEEAEARRLQQKHLAGLSEADFGFDALLDDEEEDEQQAQLPVDGSRRARATELVPELTEDMSRAERLKLLNSLYPEFEHLRREYTRLQPVLDDLVALKPSTAASRIRQMALSSYIACLCMYFTLLVSPASKQSSGVRSTTVTILPPQQVRAHPIMARLVKCRELWSRVEESELLLDQAGEPTEEHAPVDDLVFSTVNGDEVATLSEPRKRKRKTRAERTAEAAAQEAEIRRQARIQKAQEDLADLSALVSRPTKKGPQTAVVVKPTADGDDSDFGDESALTAEEAAEKARRKKSLRFYTSQIAQKANKRERRGLMAGGDDDIPYRERFRDRQARTMDHPEDRYTRAKLDENVENDDDEDVDNDLTQIKPVKRRRGGDDGSGEPGDTKRKINYEIEKNKGLTPFRKKEVRNPRVKKRMRYEDKKKRLGSKKAIYKGGEGKGGYGGERTGINANVIKSVKL